jgi:hypothetical protein
MQKILQRRNAYYFQVDQLEQQRHRLDAEIAELNVKCMAEDVVLSKFEQEFKRRWDATTGRPSSTGSSSSSSSSATK